MSVSREKQRFRILTSLVRRAKFARNDTGSVAVEFALLALPFFAVIAAILETAIIFLASQMLETAVHDTSRLIRTGQVQDAGYTSDDFRQKVCENGFGLFDCDKLKIRVRVLNDFISANSVMPIDLNDGSWIITEQYDPGVGKSIVIAEAYYKWDTIFDVMGFNLDNSNDGTRLLGAVRVWRNEPFGGE